MTIAMRLGNRYSGLGSLEKTIFIMKCTQTVVATPIANTQITEIKIGVWAIKPLKLWTNMLKSNTTQSANSEVYIK